jgi:hypothetical protein
MLVVLENITISVTTTGGHPLHPTIWDMVGFVAMALILVSLKQPLLRRLPVRHSGGRRWARPTRWLAALGTVAIFGSTTSGSLEELVRMLAEVVGH